jgi:hypothetical protein
MGDDYTCTQPKLLGFEIGALGIFLGMEIRVLVLLLNHDIDYRNKVVEFA